MTFLCSLGKDVGESRDERSSVAANQIIDLQAAETGSIEFVIECEVDVACHSQGPVRIGGHEPGM